MTIRPGLPAVAATALVLGACTVVPITPLPPPTTVPPPGIGTCNAEGAAFAIGQVATANLVEAARRGAGAASARTLRQGQPVTLEYNGSRLNLEISGANVVTAVRCG